MSESLVLASPADHYRVVKLVGEADAFRLYLCQNGAGETYILKIATNQAYNGLLDREAYLLREMRKHAEFLEEAYAKVKEDPSVLLNYHFAFPNIVETFVSVEQEGRRVNILEFPVVEDVSSLVPIELVTIVDRVRVDPKTSAWIMGKVLKILHFAHAQGIAVGKVSGMNILIERDQHYVVVFDWTGATLSEVIPPDLARADIAQAARAVQRLLGGDPSGMLPEDEHLQDGRYTVHLQALASGSVSDAQVAHREFYTLIRELWPTPKFHPYTTYPL